MLPETYETQIFNQDVDSNVIQMFMRVQGSSDEQADLSWCVRDVLIG